MYSAAFAICRSSAPSLPTLIPTPSRTVSLQPHEELIAIPGAPEPCDEVHPITMQTLVQRLFQEEAGLNPAAKSGGRAALDICEKLRAPLATFTGVDGFRSLLGRALVLAKAKAPWLEGLQVAPDGSLKLTTEQTARLDTPEAAQGGAELVEQTVGLLVLFIGESLTLRLVQDVWPKPVNQHLKLNGAKK